MKKALCLGISEFQKLWHAGLPLGNDHSCAMLWPIPHMNQPNQPSWMVLPTRIPPSPHHLSLSPLHPHSQASLAYRTWPICTVNPLWPPPLLPLVLCPQTENCSLGDSCAQTQNDLLLPSCLHGFVHAASFAWCRLPSWADFHSSEPAQRCHSL